MYQCFYDQYKGFIYVRILALEPNHQQADELFQKSLVKIAKSKPKWNSEAQVKAWLKTVIRSVVYDHWRANKQVPKAVALVDSNIDTLQEATHERDNLAMLREKLNSALGYLSEEEQYLVESIYFDQKRRKDICEALGMSYKALESKMSRVRQKLREFVVENHER